MTDGFMPALRGATTVLLAASALALAACSSSGQKSASGKPTRSKEYFAESEYGVKASPRVTNQRSRLPRGGGRDQIGRPYKVKGQWYHPKEDPDYRNSGMASWYGDAFHGRLTANGEIYDMTHLTAAHPTMPLPSYARVTNKSNGSSVVVRVNDRGPFARGRIIDLSRRAAELLDYTHNGLAKVDVEYIGRAPLDGQDDAFLMASYRPAGRSIDPSDGLPTGVMIALNGPTPTASVSGASPAFPGQQNPAAQTVVALGEFDIVLPDFGPIAPERPGAGIAALAGKSLSGALAYADDRVKRAAQAVNDFADESDAKRALVAALNRRYADAPAKVASSEYIAVGTYSDQHAAEAMARALDGAGRILIETDYHGDGYSLRMMPDGSLPIDDMLRTAWAAGAKDALTVRE
ncbi:septal ring lytic transglycosylase RlpA family protein [Mesorhizobium sp. CAU 1741]|uniref:septal ring lytic transglycosylase RlpA family protein n=1 Tax=Mesorhizobium sp. CAU 1741 TaxID=3140366 RepID=UPI00325A767F